ncbi:hypothetical protein BU25DRAFT_405786 [Macroventuria anomochaeta]|uniref:Uncharacterized protein n=1 Tax=Macroventuria anomochaeta TaxID=301207 RepID=A0ACB6SJT5_9PLEO|nr:uncharacterized protein BU25DRAFT_405786 [Macroventuria anomochaeta]KAF2633957.1 hypothetical protein BU25DRAFT_405786 [Macroventuria anomochaeta]
MSTQGKVESLNCGLLNYGLLNCGLLNCGLLNYGLLNCGLLEMVFMSKCSMFASEATMLIFCMAILIIRL